MELHLNLMAIGRETLHPGSAIANSLQWSEMRDKRFLSNL
ncbi:hypothetical protein CSC12_6169 (plasmid) [Klebsiella michiganensis]|nr:hypothetical protein CSC12_6169 [Klebsiella michiganensis]